MLPISLSEIKRIREIANGSMHLVTGILKHCPDVREVHKPPVKNLPSAPHSF